MVQLRFLVVVVVVVLVTSPSCSIFSQARSVPNPAATYKFSFSKITRLNPPPPPPQDPTINPNEQTPALPHEFTMNGGSGHGLDSKTPPILSPPPTMFQNNYFHPPSTSYSTKSNSHYPPTAPNPHDDNDDEDEDEDEDDLDDLDDLDDEEEDDQSTYNNNNNNNNNNKNKPNNYNTYQHSQQYVAQNAFIGKQAFNLDNQQPTTTKKNHEDNTEEIDPEDEMFVSAEQFP